MRSRWQLRQRLRPSFLGRVNARYTSLLGRSERGSSLVELALMLPVLGLLLFGAIDFARGYYLSIEVTNAAHAGAQFGVQNASVAGMQNAATSDAADVAGSDVPGMTASAIYGCECPDGTDQVPNCSSSPGCANAVNYVQVTTNATYTPLIPWPGVPSSIPLQGQATMRIGP
jgi:Flp pilus assembly protein TadG